MSGFEEEAFNRAQQMHRRVQFSREAPKKEPPKPQPPKEEKPKEEIKPTQAEPKNENGLLDLMFKNKEQSLILLLVVLLMEEKTDPSVLLALMYLLM